MPPTQHETGLVDADSAVHAVKKGISGSAAWCGAGRITKPLAGRFNSDGADSCVACSAQVADKS